MSEQRHDAFEMRSRTLFHDSVEALDMRIRSRLTQARSAALGAARGRRSRWSGWRIWTPAAGVTAAAILGVVLWIGSPLTHQSGTMADVQTSFEDLDLVASSDEGATDAMDMLQDDIDFYAFADRAANSGPAA
ncbi:MAG TPA: hypothetical protein VHW95_12965 [Steroidobacteraceae bacterium]|jgi:hypothetical protein|nr:hypothetical protein [Steroidobacteraceae bacterium]